MINSCEVNSQKKIFNCYHLYSIYNTMPHYQNNGNAVLLSISCHIPSNIISTLQQLYHTEPNPNPTLLVATQLSRLRAETAKKFCPLLFFNRVVQRLIIIEAKLKNLQYVWGKWSEQNFLVPHFLHLRLEVPSYTVPPTTMVVPPISKPISNNLLHIISIN